MSLVIVKQNSGRKASKKQRHAGLFTCDPAAGSSPANNPGSDNTSRVFRSKGSGLWEDVPTLRYKNDSGDWSGIVRRVLIGDRAESTCFHVRYFEISPGGMSSLERHAHEHVVIVLSGQGEIRLDDEWHELGMLDLAYVAPNDVHQLRNRSDSMFGFLCIVDAERDRPVPVSDKGLEGGG